MQQTAIRVPWGYEDVQHLLDNSIRLGRVGQHWWYATETGDPKEPWAMWCDADIDRLAQGAWVPAKSLSEIEREWYEIFWLHGHADEICYMLGGDV